MSMLKRLGLPSLSKNISNELENYMYLYKGSYSSIKNDAKQKVVLNHTFDILSGLFDLDFDEKLKFVPTNNAICITNIDGKEYNELFFELFSKCFMKYIEKLHTIKKSKIDSEIYTICKLASLNDRYDILNGIMISAYKDLLKNDSWLEYNKVEEVVFDKNIMQILTQLNIQRNQRIKEMVMSYSPLMELSPVAISNVFKCFSSDIFNTLHKKEKMQLFAITYNYFATDEKKDMKKLKKGSITELTTNVECLSILISELLVEGKTMLIMRRNQDMINNVLSWISVIADNEIKQENIETLKKVYDLSNLYRR